MIEHVRYRPRATDKKRMLANYWMRNRRSNRRGLVNRLRRIMFPNARKAGPTFPSIRPSRPSIFSKFMN